MNALEIAKTARKFGRQLSFRLWFLVGTALGVAFLAGQWIAWKELAAQGIFLPTSPHSSFFYILTGTHAVHIVAGLAALTYALSRRWSNMGSALSSDAVALCSTYWHFVTGIWVYLYVLLFIWR